MTELLITGGRQREKRGIASGNKRWYRYGEAHMVRVDTYTGSMETALSYTTPEHLAAAEDPAILFKQGHRLGDLLYLTTQTEVLIFSYPEPSGASTTRPISARVSCCFIWIGSLNGRR